MLFKSLPIRDDSHYLTVCRYVDRDALRAQLVSRVEDWRWCWLRPTEPSLLSSWPVPRLPNWVARVDEPLTDGEREGVRRSVQQGRAFGDPHWRDSAAARFGLQSTLRPLGRSQVRFTENVNEA